MPKRLSKISKMRVKGSRVSKYVFCVDLIVDFHWVNITYNIESNSQAKLVYQDVLSRKDRADSARSALTLLQRNKQLFTLRHTLERHIHRGEHHLVIADYMRAKALYSNTPIPLFQRGPQPDPTQLNSTRLILYIHVLDACQDREILDREIIYHFRHRLISKFYK